MTTDAGNAGAPAAGAAGAPAAGAAGAPAAGAAGSANQPAAGAPAAAPWHGITDADAAAYITNKGWASPADVIRSYQGAERLIGRDPNSLVTIPRADDPEGFRAIASKLGMPEKAADYKLDIHKEFPADDAYQGYVKDIFHKAGLTAAQAAAISKGHNEYLANAAAQASKDYDLNVESDKRSLMKEWGGGFERMMNRASLAAKSLGLPPAAIDALEQSMGYAGVMKLMSEVGGKLGEDSLTGTGGGGVKFSNAMTPAEASGEWDAMKADPAQRAALFDSQHPGHKAATEKQKRLFGIMHPGE